MFTITNQDCVFLAVPQSREGKEINKIQSFLLIYLAYIYSLKLKGREKEKERKKERKREREREREG